MCCRRAFQHDPSKRLTLDDAGRLLKRFLLLSSAIVTAISVLTLVSDLHQSHRPLEEGQLHADASRIVVRVEKPPSLRATELETKFPRDLSTTTFRIGTASLPFWKTTAPPGACRNGTDTCPNGLKCYLSSDDGPELA